MNMTLKLLMGILWLALLAGCGQKEATDGSASAPKPRKQASQSQAPLDPYVKAVTVTVGESPVELRFELPQRPAPKQPIPMHLRLTGLLDSTALTLKLTGNDHVQIVSGDGWALDALAAGQAQEHDVTVKTDGTGVFVMDVAVQATRDNYTKIINFAIPLAVTDPASVAASASSVAASAAK